MDEAAEYRHRAEECLALALVARDGIRLTESVEMAVYWFNLNFPLSNSSSAWFYAINFRALRNM